MQTKPLDAAFLAVFQNSIYARPEAAGDVISGMALDYVSTVVPASFGDSGLNIGLCLAGPVLCTFMQYLNKFCSRLELASDVVSSMFVRLFFVDKQNFVTLAQTILEKFHPKALEVVFLTATASDWK